MNGGDDAVKVDLEVAVEVGVHVDAEKGLGSEAALAAAEAAGPIGAYIEEALAQLLESIGLPPSGACAWLPPGAHTAGLRWASLAFEGEGPAGVAVGLSPLALERVTEAMTGLPPEAQDPELLQDIVGEFANILGGNLQPMLEGTTGLCLPSRAAPATLPPGPTLRCCATPSSEACLAVRLMGRTE